MSAPLVFVSGGKGGVGKTALAASLGVELARAGAAPLVVDLDLGLGDLAIALGLEPTRTSEDLLLGDASLAACVVPGPAGTAVLPAGSGVAELARGDDDRRARLLAALDEAGAAHGVVLADGAAGIGGDVLPLAAAADRVLCVTAPDPAALADAYGLVKALDRHAQELGADVPTPDVVVNLAAGPEDARATFGRLREACERFLARSPRLAGWVPRSDAVRRAAAARRPFALAEPDGAAATAVRRLAAALLRSLGDPVPAAETRLKAPVPHGR